MFGIVINQEGNKVGFVVLNEDKTPQNYELQDGEQIIEKDWAIVNAMNKPKWDFDNEVWIETEPLDEVIVERPKTENEILQERIGQLEAEKSILAQNVYDMATIIEYIILGGAE